MESRYNLRVYGLYIKDSNVLVSEEYFGNKLVVKYPGGGLELGESFLDCLRREIKEELHSDIEIINHFYTTDFYQKSAIDNRQIISIFYRIDFCHKMEFPYNNGTEKFYFLPINEHLPNITTLPIENIVSKMLVESSL